MKVQEIQATDLPLRASAEARSASQVNMTPASSHETFRTCWGFVHKSGLVMLEGSESRRETMHETLLASIALGTSGNYGSNACLHRIRYQDNMGQEFLHLFAQGLDTYLTPEALAMLARRPRLGRKALALCLLQLCLEPHNL